MGFHFLTLALSAFISFHFGLVGVSFWSPIYKLPKMARLPNVLTMDLRTPWPAPFCNFLPSWAFISLHFGFVGFHPVCHVPYNFHFGPFSLHFLSFWPFGPSFPFILALSAPFPLLSHTFNCEGFWTLFQVSPWTANAYLYLLSAKVPLVSLLDTLPFIHPPHQGALQPPGVLGESG